MSTAALSSRARQGSLPLFWFWLCVTLTIATFVGAVWVMTAFPVVAPTVTWQLAGGSPGLEVDSKWIRPWVPTTAEPPVSCANPHDENDKSPRLLLKIDGVSGNICLRANDTWPVDNTVLLRVDDVEAQKIEILSAPSWNQLVPSALFVLAGILITTAYWIRPRS